VNKSLSNESGNKSEGLHDVAVDLPELVDGGIELPEGDEGDGEESKVTKKGLNLSTNGKRQLCTTILHFEQFF